MLVKYWNDPLYRFLTKAVLLYILYYFVYELWLNQEGTLDLLVIRNLEDVSSFVLQTFGYSLISESHDVTIRTLGIDGTNGIWIGDPCNGLTLFALFTGFVIAFPGPIKTKAWFIPVGLMAIHILNILRIIALALIIYYFPDPEVLEFNHTYTFTLIVYGFVFWLWYLWANRFSGISMKKEGDEQA